MGRIAIRQLEPKNELTICLEKIHLDLLEGIEEAYDVEMSDAFWSKMNSPNLAFLDFDGEMDGNTESIRFMAHSAINEHKPQEPITKFLDGVYEFPLDIALFSNGKVNRFNTLCVDDLEILNPDFQKNIWDRKVDSESKVLESFLSKIPNNTEDITGSLLVYTYYYPCLSCSNKVVKILKQLSSRYPSLDIDILYVMDYGKMH